ncbi:hypothetical protein [Rhodohalobacter sp.]|uniref:hypothetical protein n=1 Tax=Rhodohalobacter sp. TaxID=1974210 RepID=UPI002ACD88F7|nr:hypothetical protein [Rhodohalobacter sp.]MDZ7757735.1 hypothetical protein [Rhodohalobacter sp.]
MDQALSSTFTITPASGYIHPFTGEFILTGTPVLEKDQPSAKEVADQYVETTTAIDKYYGNLVSHFWEVSRWGKIKFNNFDNLAGTRNEVIDANERILNDIWSRQGLFFEFIPGPEGANEEKVFIRDSQNNIVDFDFEECESASLVDDEIVIPDCEYDRSSEFYKNTLDTISLTRVRMENRQERMYVLANDNDWQDTSWRQQSDVFRNKLDEFENNVDFRSFFGTFIQKGIEYWYEIPKRGLTQISQSTAFTADSLASDYKSKVWNVVNAHHNFTNTLDDIYRVKSSLTLTLHGIVDLYISELETVTNSMQTDQDGNITELDIEDAAEDMRQLKQEIENTLQPPKIMNLRVHKHLDQYNNKVNLFWSASHPSGTITEYSYMMMDESILNSEIGTTQLGQMLSTGNQNSVNRYLFKENEDQVNKTMQVLVRARGPSGTAISRPGNFTVSVDIDDGNGSFFESQGSPENLYEVDGSPPLRPNVEFDYEEGSQQILVAQQQQTSQDQIQISDFTQNFGVIPQVSYEIVEQNVYWTNIADRIEFDVYSIDPESDISGYEYALGTSVSATDIRDWTPIQGLNLETGFLGESNLNDWQRIRIQNVDLSEKDHFLSIRAINGEGLESNKRFVDKPIVYSGEPPSTPEFNDIEMPVIQAGRPEVNDPIFESPTVIYSHLSDFIPPKLEISWQSAVSLRSGIYGYEYVISENANADESFGQADEIHFSANTEATLTNSHGISYRHNFYVHLRAVDNAGNRSENAATLGPIVVPDPTRPDTPIIRASAKSGTIGFYLQGAGRDRESERDKYEFTFSRSGGSNKIPWTEIPIQWLMSDFTLNKASYKVAPITSAYVGDPLILKLRAVNKQGIHSGISRSGTIIYDTSPPNTPTINLSKSGDTMTINISNIHDPESGVKRVEYLVCNVTDYGSVEGGCGHYLVNPYRELVSYRTSRSGSFSLTKQVPISGSLSSKKVFVRVTNRNEMQTTASYQPVQVINISGSEQQDAGDFELNNWWLEYDF